MSRALAPLSELVLIPVNGEMTGHQLRSIITYTGHNQETFSRELERMVTNAGRTRAWVSDATRDIRPIPKIVVRASVMILQKHFLPAYNAYKVYEDESQPVF